MTTNFLVATALGNYMLLIPTSSRVTATELTGRLSNHELSVIREVNSPGVIANEITKFRKARCSLLITTLDGLEPLVGDALEAFTKSLDSFVWTKLSDSPVTQQTVGDEK